MPSNQSLSNRYEQHLKLFYEHLADVDLLHQQSIQELLPQLIKSHNLSPISIELMMRFLEDRINLFRFLNRNNFDIHNSILALSNCIEWRLESNIDLLSPSSLDPIYFQNPLLFFHDQLRDKWGRSCAILNLRYVTRTQDGSLDGLKEFIAWTWEVARRSMFGFNLESISNIYSSDSHSPQSLSAPSSLDLTCPSPSSKIPSLQICLIVDLKDASMSNLEVELIPYLVHLLKYTFPDMVGVIFILNYGWMYAGMWQVVKRILTQATLDRILFPSQEELLDFFDRSNLLVEHGGFVVYRHGAQQNQFMNRFGKPANDLSSNQKSSIGSISRHPSAESIHDIFFSAVNTPYPPPSHPGTPNRVGNLNHSHRKPSWLNMTSYHSSSQISSSSVSEALKHNQSKSFQQVCFKRSSSDFQLKLPSRTTEDQDGETSEDSTVARLTSGRLSPSSSSSSLSEISRQPLLSQQPDQDSVQHKAPVPRKRNKGDYFCIKLIIKFGYFLRTLQMLVRILTAKVMNHSRPSAISGREDDSSNDDDNRRFGIGNPHRFRDRDDLHHRRIYLHQLFILLNLQRKKMMSSLGCLLLFLIFLKKKKN